MDSTEQEKLVLDRRKMLKVSAAAGALYWLGPKLMFGGRVVGEAAADTLSADSIKQYVAPLVIPPVMPPTDPNMVVPGGKNVAYYEISVRQFEQQILPGPDDDPQDPEDIKPKTTVWSYCSETNPVATLNYPAFTMETTFNKPVRVKWINGLVDANNKYLSHLLPVDPTLHWANPPQGTNPSANGTGPKDSRPIFPSTPKKYKGPVPIVTHVHGQEAVGEESDGYPEAWFLPDANNIPAGYATEGTFYPTFKAQAEAKYAGVAWGAGYAVFQYPNDQRAGTIWYHDHTLGMTRLNVYAGPAGFWLVSGGPGDGNVKGYRRPQLGDPPGVVYTEIPIVIQDRTFIENGALFYPESRVYFDNPGDSDLLSPDPYIPATDISPIWNPEFFGDVMVVNGKSWPYLEVEPRRYRFRCLNGCDSRFLILQLVKGDVSSDTKVKMSVIGNDGGLLPEPVTVDQLPIGLAERYDVIIDFTGYKADDTFTWKNLGPDAPHGGGEPGVHFDPANPATTGQVMQFRVVALTAKDQSKPVSKLNLPPIKHLTGNTPRRVALLEEMSAYYDDAPAEALLGVVTGDPFTNAGSATKMHWMDPITENPTVGNTEVWEIYNLTADVHPIHIHENFFEIIDRHDLLPEKNGGSITNIRVMPGTAQPPQPFELGFKDTVNAFPDQVTRVRLKFKSVGRFVWHCHIVSHEDNEMMRPYEVKPA